VKNGVRGIVESCEYKGRSRKREQDFTRERKMGFKKLIYFLLSMINESTQNALERFFSRIGEPETRMTQQSFSEARQKIKWEAIREILDQTVKDTYSGYTERWNGYRVSAIDGSKISLPSDAALREYFGTSGKGSSAVTAQASMLYDVYNDTVIDARLEPMRVDERTLAIEHVEKLRELSSYGRELIIFDRGYPSFELISLLISYRIKFLMRVRQKFNTAIDESKSSDFRMRLVGEGGKQEKVRVLKFVLPGGETEMLITNLFSKRLDVEAFKGLYFKRWPVETKYDVLKNKLAIENFSGLTETAVRQDFYAAMALANIASAFYWDAQEMVEEEQRGKDNKYEYHVNINHEIGVLKDKFVEAIIEPDIEKQDAMIEAIIDKIKSRIVPVRPGRSIPRKIPRKQKFYHNYKLNC
jgi:hypothetical protein